MAFKNYIQQDDKSQFNSSFACLERIHRLLIDCGDYSRLALSEGYVPYYLNLWKLTILALYREIISNFKPEEYKKETEKFNQQIENLKKIGSIYKEFKDSDNEVEKKIDVNKFLKNWNVLSSMELHLRFLATEKGMLIKKKDSY